MDVNDNVAVGTGAISTGATVGIANATMTYLGAVAAAEATGLSGGAAITTALSTLGGGSLATGGGGIAAGMTALFSAAAWPAVTIAVAGFTGYKLYKWLR
jgi:hypothetical protein